jgi:hypothetical protein
LADYSACSYPWGVQGFFLALWARKYGFISVSIIIIRLFVRIYQGKNGVFSVNFTENLCMDFYEKIKRHVKMRSLTIDGYFSSLFAGDKNKEAFSGWKKRHIYPRADEAIVLAKDMQTTVEELVDGEEGEQYLREYVQEKGWQFSPPERIVDIVEALQRLSDDELVPIRGAIKAILDKKEASGVLPDIKSGEKTG